MSHETVIYLYVINLNVSSADSTVANMQKHLISHI